MNAGLRLTTGHVEPWEEVGDLKEFLYVPSLLRLQHSNVARFTVH